MFMNKKKQQFIKGAGSIIDICPSPQYNKIIPKQTVEQRIESSWSRVKTAFEKTLTELPHHEKKQK